ncbi:MAG: HNH endonuclease [Bdellovibrionaceae bacterium]|nr:HNH endonuclease [Pseudobdellovibrionaceae bacterium]
MTLINLTDASLVDRFQKLVRTERKITHLILECIAEIDRRQLYLDKAFPSLFEYLTQAHGYSAGAAQRRISAARLLKEVPQVAAKIEAGQINLSQIALTVQTIKQAEKQFSEKMDSEAKLELLEKLEAKSFVETQQILRQELKVDFNVPDRAQHHADGSVTLTITFSREQYADWVKAGELASHAAPTEKAAELAHYLAKKEIARRTDISRRGLRSARRSKLCKTEGLEGAAVKSPRAIAQLKSASESEAHLCDFANHDSDVARVSESEVPPTHSSSGAPSVDVPSGRRPPLPRPNPSRHPRQIPPSLRKSLLRHAACRYRDPRSGKICGSRRYLQIDHIHPISDGGTSAPANLQPLCGAHNRWRSAPPPR